MNNTSTATSESARLREVRSKMLGLHPTLLEMDRNRFERLDFGKLIAHSLLNELDKSIQNCSKLRT